MTTPAQPTEPRSGSNVFTRKLGPLPMWGWMGIAALLAVLFYLHSKNSSSSSTAASGTSSGTGDSTTDSSLVPQFVNQTYVQNAPPSAPPTSTATTGTSTAPASSAVSEILTAGHVLNPSPSKAEIGWTISQKSPQATQLKVVLNGPGVKNQTRYVPATATTASFEGLQGGHNYTAQITPVDAGGQAVGGPNNVDFKTSAK